LKCAVDGLIESLVALVRCEAGEAALLLLQSSSPPTTRLGRSPPRSLLTRRRPFLFLSPWSRPLSTCVPPALVAPGCGGVVAARLVSPTLDSALDHSHRTLSTTDRMRVRVHSVFIEAAQQGEPARGAVAERTSRSPRLLEESEAGSRSRGSSTSTRRTSTGIDTLLPPRTPPRPVAFVPSPSSSSPLIAISLRLAFASQVLRYTALASGIVYGVVHRKTLQDKFDHDAARKEVQLREHWLQEAKKAWAAKQQGNSGRASLSFLVLIRPCSWEEPALTPSLARPLAVITDPDAPGFDLEAVLKSFEK